MDDGKNEQSRTNFKNGKSMTSFKNKALDRGN